MFFPYRPTASQTSSPKPRRCGKGDPVRSNRGHRVKNGTCAVICRINFGFLVGLQSRREPVPFPPGNYVSTDAICQILHVQVTLLCRAVECRFILIYPAKKLIHLHYIVSISLIFDLSLKSTENTFFFSRVHSYPSFDLLSVVCVFAIT